MTMNKKQIKQKYFGKVYSEAKIVECACGCGKKTKNKDHYGRDKKFINGHNNRKYDDPTQYKREWNHRNRSSRYEYKVARGHRLKVKIIKLMGGRCEDCKLKYNGKNACVFQVHHKNPANKLSVINTRTIINYAWGKTLEEIKKCALLCANCHFVEHNEKY